MDTEPLKKQANDLKRIAGVVRKEGWPEEYSWATVSLSGSVFSNLPDEVNQKVPGHYSKQTVMKFMEFQEVQRY